MWEELSQWSKKCFESVHQDLEQKKKQLQRAKKIASQGGDTEAT